jgi:DNA-binding FrmR family transcriptional regulator
MTLPRLVVKTHYSPTTTAGIRKRNKQMQANKQDVLKRLNYIEGHLGGIRKMVEEDKYCVDILRQTYAVRKAIEKLESLLVEGHLHGCVPEGIASGNGEAIIEELVQLYNLAGNR